MIPSGPAGIVSGETSMHTTPPEGYPARYEGSITIRNGRGILIRPIVPSDGPLIMDLFSRISPQSIFQRFLRQIHSLPEDLLHHFTHVDYESDFALVAIASEGGKDAVIAVGRYAHDPHEDVTDLAIAVRDDWQHQGLGKPLLEKVVTIAREHGIHCFVSMMDPGNAVMEKILRDLGYEVNYSLRNGFYHVEINV